MYGAIGVDEGFEACWKRFGVGEEGCEFPIVSLPPEFLSDLDCKLTELNGVPRMKFSQDADKATLPGNKSIYRVWTKGADKASFDVITLEKEKFTTGVQTFYSVEEESFELEVDRWELVNTALDIFKPGQSLD